MRFLRFIGRFYRYAWPLAGPLTLTIVLLTVLFCTGHRYAAGQVSRYGVISSYLFALVYIHTRPRR